MKLRCSRCGNPINDNIVVRLESSVTVLNVNSDGITTPYTNFKEPTSEFLCLDCFDKYCDCLNKLNEENVNRNIFNMVEIIDDIQYDDNIEAIGSEEQK